MGQGQEVIVVTQLVEGLVKTLDGCRVVPQTGNRPGKFHARPEKMLRNG